MRQHRPSAASSSSPRPAWISRRGLLTTATAATALAAAGVSPVGAADPAPGGRSQQPEAASGALVDANLFEFTRPVRVTYSRTSISGIPLFSYQDTGPGLSFLGGQITRLHMSWGELVSVTIEHRPDAFVRTFTLVVPAVRLVPGDQAEFDTVGIETTDRSGAFVPPPGPSGVLQTYRIHRLHGTARQVAF